ncbi:Endoribonuclease Dicer [Halotydeus destructor]|nr:Endoribonuclease Dicer [Halotydeus destructor]
MVASAESTTAINVASSVNVATGIRYPSRNKFDNMPVDKNDFEARSYQNQLFELAKERNTIVCLRTGTGKTYIAVLLIKELSHQIRGPFDGDGKRTVFLVPEVCLVQQQATVIERHTDLKVAHFYGAMNVDTFSKEDWVGHFSNNHVLVMTAEIFRVILHHAFIPLSKVNLLIFDEAHHACKNHPYNEIMKCFDTCQDQPRVLGLSASLITTKAKPDKIEKMINVLEGNLKSKCETAGDISEVNKHATNPNEIIVTVSSNDVYDPEIFKAANDISIRIHDFLERFMKIICLEENDRKALSRLKKCLTNLADALDPNMGLGLWCAREIADLYATELGEHCAMAVHKDICGKVSSLYSVGLTIMKYAVVKMDLVMSGLDIETKCRKFASLKMLEMLKILEHYHPSCEEVVEGITKEDLCGIVFVERRIVVKVLTIWLQRLAAANPERYGFLKVEGCVGQACNGADTPGVLASIKQQEQVLYKFRKQEYNLIVATSVLEEGLDVPKCNLAIRFDFPKTVREYIQSKGRVRRENGKYVFLVPEKGREKLLHERSQYLHIEMKLRDVSSIEHNDDGENDADDVIPPYMPVKTDGAARVTLNSAISIINRYCLKLPSDSFTRLTPKHKIVKRNGGYVCELRLPINSKVREPIEGLTMSNQRLAKKAAALKACELLHIAGELDDNFLPSGKELTNQYLAELELDICDDDGFEKSIKGQPRAGTTKRRQYYNKGIADVLKGECPQPKVRCYLYVFGMKLVNAIPEEQNSRGRKICDPADSTRCLGILSTSKLPGICDFPVFTRSGEVHVNLKEGAEEIYLTEQQVADVLKFHKYTFSDVLKLEKYPMKFDQSRSDCAYYVVPCNYSIYSDNPEPVVDWKFLERTAKYEEPSGKLNKDFVFDRESFEDAVIKPWYRQNKIQQFFYVAEILDDYSPLSRFPSSQFDTFRQYYIEKYGIEISNLKQPLLDVDHTSARLNLLTPRHINRKGVTLPSSTAKTKKDKRENMQEKQILVPELCIVHPFPASFWRKLVCLPCMLYRLNQFLLSEQLRQKIVLSTGIGQIKLPGDKKWPALDFGWKASVDFAEETEKAVDAVENEKEPRKESDPVPDQQGDGFVIDTFDASMYTFDKEIPLNQMGVTPIGVDGDWGLDLDNMDLENGVFDIAPLGETIGNWDGKAKPWTEKKPATNGKLKPVNTGAQIREVDDFGNPVNDDSDSDSEDCRVGSPSNFESERDTHWTWDESGETAKFVRTNIEGLEQIYATGEININGLCEDLSKTTFDDEYGSEDEVYEDDDEDEALLQEYAKRNADKKVEALVKLPPKETVNEILADDFLSASLSNLAEEEESDEVCEETLSESDPSSVCQQLKRTINAAMAFIDVDGDSCKKQKLSPEKMAVKTGEPAFGELLTVRDDSDITDDEIRVHHDVFKGDGVDEYGPSPSVILQALSMSNASDGINLERLETVGDSFLKYAVTVFCYVRCDNVHEGQLSRLRSIQISNRRLYNLGKKMGLGELMTAIKFEPSDNWLPPCYVVPEGLEKALIKIGVGSNCDLSELRASHVDLNNISEDGVLDVVQRKSQSILHPSTAAKLETFSDVDSEDQKKIPYNLLTQHSIPDKSIADCVEALIGAYLLHAGQRGALLFMNAIGLKVMIDSPNLNSDETDPRWRWLPEPKAPLRSIFDESDLVGKAQQKAMLNRLYTGQGLDAFEEKVLHYKFSDKAYLVQAFTHNSYYDNPLTDCYQRLEFLGDAVLDFLITRHLYEDNEQHSPGALTDLRSALVNNAFFASLAVKYNFNKYMKMCSHELYRVIDSYVKKFYSSDAKKDYNLLVGEEEVENMEGCRSS